MPSGTLPNAGSLGDPQITTGDYQTQINQLLSYVRSLQSELAALSDTTFREGAVRAVGTGADELPDKEILDTRLGTTGNLGEAALRGVGTADGELVESDRIDSFTYSSFGVAAGSSGFQLLSSFGPAGSVWTINVRCESDSFVSVYHGDRSPPSGAASAWIQVSGGDVNAVIYNNTGSTQQFEIIATRIDA